MHNLAHGRLQLFSSYTPLGWRVVRQISLDKGDRMVLGGKFRRVYSLTTGELLGFQMVAPEADRGDYDLPTVHSPAAISANEMQLNCERSKTANLAEDERLLRRHPEDRIERVQAKVREWGKARVRAVAADVSSALIGWDAHQELAEPSEKFA